jgi:transposase
MGKPHPIELRTRVVAFVEEGNSNREAARHFRVSPRFVNNMMILHRSSGSRSGSAGPSVRQQAFSPWPMD